MKSSILIIEDELHLCELISELFRRLGYRVFCANTGSAGLETFTRYQIDTVLSDMCLPDINGFKMIEQMQHTKHNKHCQFHMMSGYFEQSEEAIEALNVINCFEKPDDIFTMPEKINNHRLKLSPSPTTQ